MYKKGQSVEDLAKLMRSIEDEDLTLMGRDKQGGGGVVTEGECCKFFLSYRCV